jgi:hypothetical protein
MSPVATLSVENIIAENPDFSELVKTFGEVKARKVNFH